jgi:hypothetical protein
MALTLTQLERVLRALKNRLPLVVAWARRKVAPRVEDQQLLFWIDDSDPRFPRLAPLVRFGPHVYRMLGVTRHGYYKLDPSRVHYNIIGTSLGSFRADSASPAVIGSYGAGSLEAFDFEAGSDEDLFFSVQLPYGYKEGSDVVPRIKWGPDTTGTGTVIFNLEYAWYNDEDSFPGSSTTITITVNADGTQEIKHNLFEAISGSGKTAGSTLHCRLEREGATDTYAGDVWLMGLDFIYEVDSFGADGQEVKNF